MADDETLEEGAAPVPPAEALADEPEAAPAEPGAASASSAATAAPSAFEEEEVSARAPRGTKAAKKPVRTTAKTTAERGTYVRTAAESSEQGRRRERRGVVTSDKGDKTITVRVDVTKAHRKYKKIMRRSIKLRVHDERNEAKVGDTVRVASCRPMSATKRWRLVEVVEVAR